ncbi:hypothetical protein HMPREF1554_01119, partial [Porphyromonas gingivalis F0569]
GENDTEKILLDSLLFLQRAPIVKATHTTENSPKRPASSTEGYRI